MCACVFLLGMGAISYPKLVWLIPIGRGEGYDGHVNFDALYLRRKCRCRFVALAQTSLNISACISHVIDVSMHKFTN